MYLFQRAKQKGDIHKSPHSRNIINNTLLGIFFMMIGSLFTSLSFYLFDYFLPFNNPTKTIIYVLILFIVIIPSTIILSKRAVKTSIKKQILFITFFTVIVFYSVLFHFTEFRKTNLDDVISFNPNKVDYILIGHDFVKTNKKEHAEQLKELLSQYRVKKMKDSEWNPDVSKEKGVQIIIYSDGKPIIAFLYENRVLSLNRTNYYHVLNGPIDFTWFDELYEQSNS